MPLHSSSRPPGQLLVLRRDHCSVHSSAAKVLSWVFLFWQHGYGRWCWPWAASWLPGGRSWCDWGSPCWTRIWFCCSRCSWCVSWGFWGAAWSPCSWSSCIIDGWLSTASISGSAFPSTETETEVWKSRFLPANRRLYKDSPVLTNNLWRGF